MTGGSQATVSRAFAFGPFRLLPDQQLLLEGDAPVKIGARALEILLALVERPGELVGKSELLSRGWPSTFVEPDNLKVNVAALRKALGEPSEHPQYIATVSGRGYRFVAPVAVLDSPVANSGHLPVATSSHNIPIPITRIVGRDRSIDDLRRWSSDSRLLTISGAGGIGKTTVALAVARAALTTFQHGAWVVDLAPLVDPMLVARTIATTVGLTVHSEDASAALVAFLRDKDLMLVLDNCEHLIDGVAEIAERLVSATAGVHIVATSREPLRVPGEKVFRLPPLETPPGPVHLTAADALTFAAVELFVERAKEAGEFVLSDGNAPVVGDICRELDGIALAIELAATRVSGLGIETLSTALADRFRLLTQGTRSAPARQRTLYATLDWSHQLLTEAERTVLQRLSLFAGSFGLEAAAAVVAFGTISRVDVTDALANLVSKSLVSMSRDAMAQYRLLETTRAYAREKLVEGGVFAQCALRHAEYFRDELKRAKIELQGTNSSDWLRRHARKIDDVRAALKWALSGNQPSSIGVSLVVEAIPLWSRMSLLEECRAWVERVIATPALRPQITDSDRMILYGAFGAALLYTRGPDSQVMSALSRSMRLAERLADAGYLARALWTLSYFNLYVGDHRAAFDFATRLKDLAKRANDDEGKRDADRILAAIVHNMGDHRSARRLLLGLINDDVESEGGRRLARFQLNHRVSVNCSLAQVLFVQGFADQALRCADIAIQEAKAIGHPVSLGSTLWLASVPLALYRGDLQAAERLLTMLTDLVAKHGLVIWSAITDCLQGALLTMKGEEAGKPSLRRALDSLRATNFGVRYPAYLGLLAQAQGATGEREEATRTIEAALRWSKRHEELWCLPELIRIKGGLLRLEGSAAANRAAEKVLVQGLQMARRQRALSWELRSGVDLAKLWHCEGKAGDARALLLSIYNRFTEGFETADLRAAKSLLDDLSRGENPRSATALSHKANRERDFSHD